MNDQTGNYHTICKNIHRGVIATNQRAVATGEIITHSFTKIYCPESKRVQNKKNKKMNAPSQPRGGWDYHNDPLC